VSIFFSFFDVFEIANFILTFNLVLYSTFNLVLYSISIGIFYIILYCGATFLLLLLLKIKKVKLTAAHRRQTDRCFIPDLTGLGLLKLHGA